MTFKNLPALILLLLAFQLSSLKLEACSMYKITAQGKTVVGCNHDAWFTTPKIWFEQALTPEQFGAAFTGAREVSGGRTTPQSGMNTAGLVFSRLSSYYPEKTNPFKDRLAIADEADYLKEILHQCASIQEVRKYIEAYDHSFFLNDVFIYIDSSGAYLIVEPYEMIEGQDPNYVLANFCPSITDKSQARKLARYRNGEDFINAASVNTSLAYCTALSDTMSVCRTRNGDGTLITSIWDTEKKAVNLYFYHDYDTVLSFDLEQELARGDHSFDLPELFPANANFEKLIAYKTPFNTIGLRILMVLIAGLLAFNALALVLSKLWGKKRASLPGSLVLLFGLFHLLLIFYLGVLLTNKSIFYFDAPYQHYSSDLISASAYIPVLVLGLLLPISLYTRKRLLLKETKLWLKGLMLSNTLVYLLLVLGFAYWGLYQFWN